MTTTSQMLVHTSPMAPWRHLVAAPQLRLDFALPDGEHVGHAVVIAMQGMAFVLMVQVDPTHRGRGHGLTIHRIIAERYGAVACETFCSDDEMRVWEAMARRRSEWMLSMQPGPTCAGRPAIYRHSTPVDRMLVATRANERPSAGAAV